VLTVAGAPEEVGEQVGVLAVQPASALLGRLKDFLRAHGLEWAYPLLRRASDLLVPRFPPDHLTGRSATRSQLPGRVHLGTWRPGFPTSVKRRNRDQFPGTRRKTLSSQEGSCGHLHCLPEMLAPTPPRMEFGAKNGEFPCQRPRRLVEWHRPALPDFRPPGVPHGPAGPPR
jgi:hypothetical protein